MISLSNMWNQRYFINFDTEKRMIDSDKRYTASHQTQQQEERQVEKTDSVDSFKVGIPVEIVEVEPEITPEEILEQARMEAQQIISEATVQAENLKRDSIENSKKAYEEQAKAGYLAGLKEGREKAGTELRDLQEQLYADIEAKANALDIEYQTKKSTMESEIVDAVITVFNKVFHIQFEDKRDILLHLINDTLMNVDTGKSFRIRVSAQNRKFLEAHILELKEKIGNDISIEIVNDMGLTEEGCIIETDGGIFNCGIDMQLSNLEKDIKSLCM